VLKIWSRLNNGSTNECWKFVAENWEIQTPLKRPRYMYRTSIINGQIVHSGGMTVESGFENFRFDFGHVKYDIKYKLIFIDVVFLFVRTSVQDNGHGIIFRSPWSPCIFLNSEKDHLSEKTFSNIEKSHQKSPQIY